jgi:hypothetical protein
MKTTRIISAFGAALLSATFLLTLAPAAHATTFPNLNYTLTLNLSQLDATGATGPFSLDLQLITGSGNVTNTVTLSDFVFTGGTALGTTTFANGNESGSLATSVILTSNTPNTASDNEFAEAFSSDVTQISFNVSQTPNSELVSSGTPIPDQFNVAILDTNLNNISTTDPTGDNTLVSSAISSSETAAQVDQYSLVAAAPEPSTYATLFVGLVALGAAIRFRPRHA